ncbi:MAG: cupredoxin domain-containing protein [Chloroflexota bacterium]
MSNRHAPDQRQLVARLFDEACAAMERADWQTAVAKLDQIMDIAPDFPGANWRHAEAHKWYQVDTLYELGRKRMDEGDWSDALQHFRQAQRRGGEYKNTTLLMGICERRLLDRLPLDRGRFTAGLSTAMVIFGCFILSLSTLFGQPQAGVPSATLLVTAASTLPPTATGAPAAATNTPNAPDTPSAAPDATVRVTQAALVISPTPARFAPLATTTPRPTPTRTVTRSIPRSIPTRTATIDRPAIRATLTRTNTFTANTATPTPTTSGGRVTFFSPTPTSPAPTRAATATPLTVPIRITASEYLFSPSNISLNAGLRTRITFDNRGLQDHDWVLMDGSGNELLKLRALAGQSVSRNFTFPAFGEYTFVCDLADHAQQGMTGRLTVQ